MSLQDLLSSVSEDGRVRVESIGENDLHVSVKDGDNYRLVLRIYPLGKTAEFLDIGGEWDELDGALEEDYREFPELLRMKRILDTLDYGIIF